MKIGEERKGQFSIENGSIVPYPVRLSWGSFGEGEAKEEAVRTAEVSIEEDDFDEQLIANRRAQSEPATLSDGGFRVSHGSLELAPYEKGPGNLDAKWSQVIEVNFAFPGIPLSLLDTRRLNGGEDGGGDVDVKEVNEVVDHDDSERLSASPSYSNLKVSLIVVRKLFRNYVSDVVYGMYELDSQAQEQETHRGVPVTRHRRTPNSTHLSASNWERCRVCCTLSCPLERRIF